MASEYPQRPKLFVLRAISQMFAAGVGRQLGHDVLALLVHVAMSEDRSGYERPVGFWNEQLVTEVGLKSLDHLYRVREVAVKAGWLAYSPGGRGREGQYHVIDRSGNGLRPESACQVQGYIQGPLGGKVQGKPKGKVQGSLGGSVQGKVQPSLPLDPNPNPSETSSLRSEVSCGEPLVAASPPDDVFLAFECNGPAKTWNLTAAKVAEYQQSFPGVDVSAECRKAWQWTRDNPERRKTARGMARFLGTWLGRAQDRAGRPAAGGGPYLSRGERVAERIKAAHMDLFTDLLGGTHDDRPDGQDGQGWGDGADPLALPPRGGAGPDEGVPG